MWSPYSRHIDLTGSSEFHRDQICSPDTSHGNNQPVMKGKGVIVMKRLYTAWLGGVTTIGRIRRIWGFRNVVCLA